VKIWDLDHGTVLTTLAHGASVTAVAAAGDTVISACRDCTVRIWEPVRGRALTAFTGDSPCSAVAVSPDGGTVLVGEQSGRLHILRFLGPIGQNDPTSCVKEVTP
jgi:WD40 repeat protein